jgi:proteic killer suppression protein
MIKGFRCRDTQRLFEAGRSRRFQAVERAALRKLDMLNAAAELSDLGAVPGNRLEALHGDREGQHSIRINRQWRTCFVWTDDGPEDVEIVDYH